MYCVVINKFLNSNYVLRHIIYDISPEDDMSSIKEKYYKRIVIIILQMNGNL